MTTHINIPKDGKIYCRFRNKIVDAKETFGKVCRYCDYFGGTAQGQGIECLWDDKSVKRAVYTATDPQAEYNRVSKSR